METDKRIIEAAEKYADSKDIRGCSYFNGLNNGFITGINSQINQILKIEFAIEQLQIVQDRCGFVELAHCVNLINSLEIQLSELKKQL